MKSTVSLRLAVLAIVAGVLVAAPAAGTAQDRTLPDDEWCRDGDHDHERYCEVREWTLPADGRVISVDASPNGGVRVEGWDRNEILVRAKVQARAESESEAEAIAREVEVRTAGTIEARGPRTGRHEGWSVSYRVHVPNRADLDLRSTNGGISIEDVSGNIDFRTTNGGIHLTGLGGDVSGSTTNGGVSIDLIGDRWDGAGLEVRTTNGGLSINVPDGYSAHLETGTVNGGMVIDFPITVQGRIDRRISADLGGGGQTIRATTTNGGVKIRRS